MVAWNATVAVAGALRALVTLASVVGCLLALTPLQARAQGEEYAALAYRDIGQWVPAGPSPEAVCQAYASLWGWNVNGYTYTTDQIKPGLWRCQRYYNGTIEPNWYTWVRGVCQTRPAPLMSGTYWSSPYWNEDTGVCYCATAGKYFDRSVQWCDYTPAPAWRPDSEKSCRWGNPVNPASGIKEQTEVDYAPNTGSLALRRQYNYRPTTAQASPPLGTLMWRLQVGPTLELPAGAGVAIAKVVAASGATTLFWKDAQGNWQPTSGSRHALAELLSGGVRTGWRFHDRGDNTVSVFSAKGRLLSVTAATGQQQTFAYSSNATPSSVAPYEGILTRVESTPGGAVDFLSDGYGVRQVVVPGATANAAAGTAASPLRYAYQESQSLGSGVAAASQLTSVTYADGSVRRYHYEDTRFPTALTGITDELGHRLSEYMYDTKGRVTRERWRLSSTAFVDEYVFSYPAAGQTQIVDPRGSALTHLSTNVSGVNLPASDSQPAGSGCAASATARVYDGNGNLTSEDDFNGHRVCRVYDKARNLEIVRVAGLAASQSCAAVVAAGSALPTGSRKVGTSWHPDWTLPTRVVEPGRVVTHVYNGQPDPFDGNSTASCAPGTAVLPDGKPIVVRCKTVEQATTDVNGSSAGSTTTGIQSDDPHFANVALLLHMNGSFSTTFVDSSVHQGQLTAHGAASVDGLDVKFGTGAGVFNGTSSYLSQGNRSDLRLTSGDFTIEAWIKPNATTSHQWIADQREGVTTGNGWVLYVHNGGALTLQATGSYVQSASGAVVAGSWQHVAAVRSGSVVTLYVNGAAVASSASIVIGNETSRPFRVGAANRAVAEYFFGGRMDDLRITVGVARYTGAFTPPAQEFSGSTFEVVLSGNPPIDASVAPRTQTWTYNQYGQVLTHDGPRTDINDSSTYTYHPATTADVTLGDLASMTNALGHATLYTKYNRHGQLLESTDPNGVLTVHTYDLRQRLTSTSVGGQTTSYTYDAAGQLTRVTQPDGSWVGYEYDAAHRQTAVKDDQGNRIEYTLDNAGHRTAEHVKDPGGSLRRTLARSIDAIGRVQQTTGRE